jgi:hypothetical protein
MKEDRNLRRGEGVKNEKTSQKMERTELRTSARPPQLVILTNKQGEESNSTSHSIKFKEKKNNPRAT